MKIQTNLTVDYNGDFKAFTCKTGRTFPLDFSVKPITIDQPVGFDAKNDEVCMHFSLKITIKNTSIIQVYHACMNRPIYYPASPPLRFQFRDFVTFLCNSTFIRGNHRPLWAVWGEYLYLPPQRWLHNLEVNLVI